MSRFYTLDQSAEHKAEPTQSCNTHQGSNSCMMLSKRMTAKSLELKPANQARKRMVKDRRDCHPAGCAKPPDRPPAPPAEPPGSPTAEEELLLVRPFPE